MKLKKIKQFDWYKNKSFWVTLVLAVLLWIYISLNEIFISTIDVPLSVVPTKGRSIEQLLSNSIIVEIEGSGWSLFNYIYLNNSKRCLVNLNNVTREDSLFTIASLDFQKGLEGINKIRPRRFFPNRLVVTTGKIEKKKVDISPDIHLKTKKGFVLVGNIYADPSSVVISGNKKSLEHINNWKTKYTEFYGVNSSFNHIVDLSDSLTSIIQIHPNKTKVYGEIQQYGEITFYDIELKIVGGQLPSNHTINPTNFSVTLMGGIEQLNKISAKDIEITMDYDKILNDTIGILVPTLKIPPFVKIMSISPKVICHKFKLPKNDAKI